jgi:ribulose-phosphate 3-epimerase
LVRFDMVDIIPAILPKDFIELRTSLARLRLLSSFVQIDICDGVYVPSITWPYGDTREFEEILRGDEGLPFWQDFQFEFDLMVLHPEEVIQDWIDVGASRIIVHNQSTQKLSSVLDILDLAGVEVGIALGVEENISVIDEYKKRIAFVQCMGIAEIGVQGNPHDKRVLNQIRAIREQYPELVVSVDGGVSMDTVTELVEAGAQRLVSGSGILNAKEPKDAYKEMKNCSNRETESPQD